MLVFCVIGSGAHSFATPAAAHGIQQLHSARSAQQRRQATRPPLPPETVCAVRLGVLFGGRGLRVRDELPAKVHVWLGQADKAEDWDEWD